MKNISDDLMGMKKGLTDIYYCFSELGNPTKLAIIEQLDEQLINIKQLASSLRQEQSMISHNLRYPLRYKLVHVLKEEKKNIPANQKNPNSNTEDHRDTYKDILQEHRLPHQESC